MAAGHRTIATIGFGRGERCDSPTTCFAGIRLVRPCIAAKEAQGRVNPRRRILMQFRIADTFADSLARLTGDEQKAVKTTAFDLQLNPANPGMKFHKLDRAKDKNFWSVRVNDDIRVI